MTVEYCTVCDRKFSFTEVDNPNYTKKSIGPFCDQCWFFVRELEVLQDRVTALEEK